MTNHEAADVLMGLPPQQRRAKQVQRFIADLGDLALFSPTDVVVSSITFDRYSVDVTIRIPIGSIAAVRCPEL
jgi:hypothetical protein